MVSDNLKRASDYVEFTRLKWERTGMDEADFEDAIEYIDYAVANLNQAKEHLQEKEEEWDFGEDENGL